uniref:Mur ligase family protein n=1 Tax=Massilia scottii TaxID=3057166 RepID=UPI0027B93327|nr:Mur ligase family protein [Massilia sp. CCM 9210]
MCPCREHARGEGRIPLIAVTGTNGKTTTTRLIEHAARKTGLTTGMTTTEGVYINGELTMEGDCTGYHSALSLLSAPDVDLAVLERRAAASSSAGWRSTAATSAWCSM